MQNLPPAADLLPPSLISGPQPPDASPGDRLRQAVLRLETWFETMRQPGGYAGPVVHWWCDSLDYTGPGLDWRYEGIILGYLNLWQADRSPAWLAKACRAGDDLVEGQLPSGNYRNSGFELNPSTGGTPHEAACDLALLRLAEALQAAGHPGWRKYLLAAERNLCDYYLSRLWDPLARSFRDTPDVPGFVPNKTATLVEALFAYASLNGGFGWIDTYALPAIERILEHQVPGGELKGAIYQNSFGDRKIARFFPYYIARCIPALLAAWEWTTDARLASAARRAAGFILKWRQPNGGFAQVVYPRQRANLYPQWIAGAADILRALDLARQVGLHYDPAPSLEWLLAGQRPDGGIRTALGFAQATPFRRSPDPRDQLSVCGWADKAFRYWAEKLANQPRGS